jgi:adenylate cyclase
MKMADGGSAYEKYLKGRMVFRTLTRESNLAAKAAFGEAIELDPGFARAYGWLGYAHLQDVHDGWTGNPDNSKEQALSLAKQGVGIDGKDYYTHWNLASVLAGLGETGTAIKEYEAARALNPADADLMADMADLMSFQGGASAAAAAKQIEQAIAAKIPDWYYWSLGFAYFQMRDYASAVAALQRMSDLPNTAYLLLKASEAKIGKPAPKDEILERLTKRDPGWTPDYLNRFPFADPQDERHYLDSIGALGIAVPPPGD